MYHLPPHLPPAFPMDNGCVSRLQYWVDDPNTLPYYQLPQHFVLRLTLLKKEEKKDEPRSKFDIFSKSYGRSHSQPLLHATEIEIMEIEGREREYRLQIDQMDVDIKLKDSLIQNLTEESKRQRERIDELEDEIHSLEEDLKKSEKLEELEELVVVVKQKNERIEELEEALKQSVKIASDMEMEKHDEEERRKEITEKLEQLEARLTNAQSSQSLKCPTCNPIREKLQAVEEELMAFKEERKKHLEDLFDMKHEAVTAALSEKDAHIALLEVGGSRTPQTAQEIKCLTAERDILTEKIKKQSEERIKLMQEFFATEAQSSGASSSSNKSLSTSSAEEEAALL